MAKLSTDELLDAFKEMTLIELSEFVKQFEDTFDVKAAAPAAVVAAAPGAAAAPVEAAKSLRAFARTHPVLIIKGGVFEGKAITADEVSKIADLESREVLLAKLAGAMKGNLTKAAGLFQAPLSQVARLAAALQEKREQQDGSASAE